MCVVCVSRFQLRHSANYLCLPPTDRHPVNRPLNRRSFGGAHPRCESLGTCILRKRVARSGVKGNVVPLMRLCDLLTCVPAEKAPKKCRIKLSIVPVAILIERVVRLSTITEYNHIK